MAVDRTYTLGGGMPESPVVLIALDPCKYRNGHVSYVVAHALAAREAGFSPHIFCAGSITESEVTEFGTVHRVATPLRHFLLAPVNTRPIAGAVSNYLAASGHEPPYVIHGFGTWAGTAVDAAEQLAGRGLTGLPVASAYTAAAHEWRGLLRSLDLSHGARALLFHVAWYPWVRTIMARTERRGFERAEVVLVNYDSVADLLREAYGGRFEIRRVPYTAPTAFGSLRPVEAPAPAVITELRPADSPLIVSISRHSPVKGVDVLLHALAALNAEGVGFRACLIGPGRLLETHRRLASRLGLDGHVAIPGEVDDVLPYLRRAEIFVLPSLEEGSGSVALLEALETGAAVVASSCDGIPEDVIDGEHGLLVPPGDTLALRAALARLIRTPALRAQLAARGRQLFEDRFSAERFVAAIGEVYGELGALPRRPGSESPTFT
jgi:glycosyltransferase involved in cell wall biosynthesis